MNAPLYIYTLHMDILIDIHIGDILIDIHIGAHTLSLETLHIDILCALIYSAHWRHTKACLRRISSICRVYVCILYIYIQTPIFWDIHIYAIRIYTCILCVFKTCESISPIYKVQVCILYTYIQQQSFYAYIYMQNAYLYIYSAY